MFPPLTVSFWITLYYRIHIYSLYIIYILLNRITKQSFSRKNPIIIHCYTEKSYDNPPVPETSQQEELA